MNPHKVQIFANLQGVGGDAESSQSMRLITVNYYVAKANRPACNAADT